VPKAYLITAYRAITDQDALAEYGKLASRAMLAAGGRMLARGLPVKVYEAGVSQRTALMEFDSVEQALAARDSPAYQQALLALGAAAERDVRVMEAVE
jgi:uncharacterized protein (DUF1330 family)